MHFIHEPFSSIFRILSGHPEGMMMKDLAAELKLNRNAVAKYMGILLQMGKVEVHHIGKAKVFTFSERVPFSLLAEISPDYVIGISRNMNCIDANTRFFAWSGYIPEEILGKPIRNLSIPLFQRARIGDLARNGISSVREPVRISCTEHTGDTIFEIRSLPVVFGDCTTGCAVLIKDITKSETTEKKISLLEERYRALTGAQSELIVHSLSDGTILFANPAFSDLIGITLENLIGKKFRVKIPDEDLPLIKEHFRSIHPDYPEKSIEHRILAHSGEIRWIRWKNRGIFRHGKLIEYHSHGTDITELRTALNRLQSCLENTETMIREKIDEFLKINQDLLSEIQKRRQIERNLQRTQFCVNNSSDMILWADERGIVTSSNKSAFTTLGLHPGDILDFMKQGAGDPLQKVPWQEIWESAKQNGFILFEAIMRGRSENSLQVEVLANFLFFDDSESCCFFVRDITERKQAEDRLRLLKISVDSAYDEVFWMDLAGNILYVNDAACKTTGYSQKELCAMHIFELVPGLNPERWEEHIADVRQNRKQFFQSRHRRKDDVIIDVEIRSVYVTQGAEEYKICFARDITERKRMEMTIKESEEMLAMALYRGPLMLSIIDIDTGRYLDVNEQFTRISGYSRDEVIGKTSLELGWIGDDEYERLVRELGSTGRVTGREMRLTKKSNETVWIRYYGEKITVGGKGCLLSLSEDITDRKLAEEALHKSEERYKRVFESFVSTYYETDADGIIRVISPSVYALTGWKPEELVEKSILILYAEPRDRLALIELLKRDPVVSGFELTLKRRDGTPVFVSVNALRRYGTSGEADGILGSIREKTETILAGKILQVSEE